MKRIQDPRQAGFSFIEFSIVAALLILIIFACSTLAISGTDAQEYARRLNRATEVTQEISDQVRTEMVSCVRLFGNDAEGLANLDLVDLTNAPVPIASTRLQTISPTESIRADTSGAEITGNSLFFARLAWSDAFLCTSGATHMIDVYRWYYYYLCDEDTGPQPGSPLGLNLVRVESEPIVDGVAIDRIADAAEKAEVLLHLYDATPDTSGVTHPPCTMVWLRGQLPSVAGTLRMIRSQNGALSASPINGRPSPWSILRSQARVPGLLSYRHHSVATNFAPRAFGVSRYSLETAANGGFPHGFEIQTVGPSNGRQTMFHLVVSSTNRRGLFAWSNEQVVVATRDL
jgi:hypothetical protein